MDIIDLVEKFWGPTRIHLVDSTNTELYCGKVYQVRAFLMKYPQYLMCEGTNCISADGENEITIIVDELLE